MISNQVQKAAESMVSSPDTPWQARTSQRDAAWSQNAKGQQGFTLKTPGSPGYVSFPSVDLFESPVS